MSNIMANQIGYFKDKNGNELLTGLVRKVLWETTSWSSGMTSLQTKSLDFTPYDFVDIFFYTNLNNTSEGAGNGINDILRIDLSQSGLGNLIYVNGTGYPYGASKWYPDAQYFNTTNVPDPGFFFEAVFISADKKKILCGNLGYLVINNSDPGKTIYSDGYMRPMKIVGYKWIR